MRDTKNMRMMIFNILLLALSARAMEQTGDHSSDDSGSVREATVSESSMQRHLDRLRALAIDDTHRITVAYPKDGTGKETDGSERWWQKISFWQPFGVLSLAPAAAPTLWKLHANDGRLRPTYEIEPRGYLDTGDHIGHSFWGAAYALLFPEWDWDKICKRCNPKGWTAALFQVLQTTGMLAGAIIYPRYNLNKRIKSSWNGKYQWGGKDKINPKTGKSDTQIFAHGSFYTNHTDWLIGVLIAAVLAGFMACVVPTGAKGPCLRCRGNTKATFVRNWFHRPAMIVAFCWLFYVAQQSISLGVATMDNPSETSNTLGYK